VRQLPKTKPLFLRDEGLKGDGLLRKGGWIKG